MADAAFPITPGSGASGSVDTRTEATNSNLRQVVVLGDPSVNNNVAAVLTTDGLPTDETTPALAVRSVGSMSVSIAGSSGTVGVYLHSTAGSVAVNVGRVQETVTVRLDPGYEIGSIKGINNSISVVPNTGVGDPLYDETYNAVRVLVAGSHTAGSLLISGQRVAGTNVPLIVNTDGAIKVYDIANGTVTANVAGSLTGITNSIQVHLLSTGGTLQVKLDPASVLSGITSSINVRIAQTAGTLIVKTDPSSIIEGINSSINVRIAQTAGTLIVKLDPAGTAFTNSGATASIFTVSGTTSTAGNNTLVSPSASYNFKVYAYSIQTTGIVSSAPRFTTGASAGATDLWRPLINSVQTSSTPIGANMAIQPPGFIFATGTNTTLSLYLDTGTLVHYSVSYIKESA